MDIHLSCGKRVLSFDRELEFYKKISKDNNIKFTFVTYGDEEDIKYSEEITLCQSISTKEKKSKKLEYFQSFYYPFLIKKIDDFDIIKQNQLLGSWVAIHKAFN